MACGWLAVVMTDGTACVFSGLRVWLMRVPAMEQSMIPGIQLTWRRIDILMTSTWTVSAVT